MLATIRPFIAALAIVVTTQLSAQQAATIDRAALERLVDSVFATGLQAESLPGGVFVMVQNGRTVLAKGYGVSNLKTKRAVDPDTTL